MWRFYAVFCRILHFFRPPLQRLRIVFSQFGLRGHVHAEFLVPWREPRHATNTLIVLKNRNPPSGYTNENTNILSEFLRIYAVSSEHKGVRGVVRALNPANARCKPIEVTNSLISR
jgi:hypothetical protein